MNLIQRFVRFFNELLDTAEKASRGEAAAVYISMSLVALVVTVTAVLMLILGVHLASSAFMVEAALVAPCAS